eukprot:3067766-Rhodomonas_salina.1
MPWLCNARYCPRRACYAMPGTEAGYGATRWEFKPRAPTLRQLVAAYLSSYTCATRCPVLTWGNQATAVLRGIHGVGLLRIALRIRYALSVGRCACRWESGAQVGNAAGKERPACRGLRCRGRWPRSVGESQVRSLRVCYAMSGIDIRAYVMSGTNAGAMHMSLLCDVRYWHRRCPVLAQAISGTGIGESRYAATRVLCHVRFELLWKEISVSTGKLRYLPTRLLCGV